MARLSFINRIVFSSFLMNRNDKSQYPLALFHNSLRAIGVDMDLDEVQCMLANMIFKVRDARVCVLLCTAHARLCSV